MKLCIIITAHCPPAVIKLTLGSFIRTLKPGYELDIHIGLHSNYDHYTKDVSIFDEVKGLASIHLVDEIDWLSEEYNACIHRYSIMHAKNLINVINHIKHTDFDYLVILDQDLFFKKDVITPSIEQFPNAELIGSLFENRGIPWQSTTVLDNRNILIMPKMSIWHLILSRKGFDVLSSMIDEIHPIEIFYPPTVATYLMPYNVAPYTSIFFDTFARIYHNMRLSNREIGLLETEHFKDHVDHFYKSSFNYGQRNLGLDGYVEHINKIKEVYVREFPQGLLDFRRPVIT